MFSNIENCDIDNLTFPLNNGPTWYLLGWDMTLNSSLVGTLDINSTTLDPMDGYPHPSLYGWVHIALASLAVSSIMLLIVLGNGLVVLAIAVDRSLAGLQNWFIASLAVSDLLVGLFIMPLSLANELMGYWVFGDALCELWLSTDVLLCTASILNLCLISLDRYWSITRAVSYVRTRTRRQAVTMISVVWVTSMVVCLPPLVGWKRPQPMKLGYPLCVLSEEPGYVVYSIIGSFYLPLALMVAVYYKIYQAARLRARRSLLKTPKSTSSFYSGMKSRKLVTEMKCLSFVRMGFREPSNASSVVSQSPGEAEDIQLGNCRTEPPDDCSSVHSVAANGEERYCELDNAFPQKPDSCQLAQIHAVLSDDERPSLQSSDADSSQLDPRSPERLNRDRLSLIPVANNRIFIADDSDSLVSEKSSGIAHSRTPVCAVSSVGGLSAGEGEGSGSGLFKVSPSPRAQSVIITQNSREGLLHGKTRAASYGSCVSSGPRPAPSSAPPKARTFVAYETRRRKIKWTVSTEFSFRSALAAARGGGSNREVEAKRQPTARRHDMSNAQLDCEKAKRRIARARERRATIVLGIVMASFVGCWLPFFSIYPITLLAGISIAPELFSVIFWLGYCNSALNPLIYTIFNREFRLAFHRILCGRRR